MRVATSGILFAGVITFACIFAMAPSARAVIIAADDFSTDGALVGSTPNVGGVWASHNGAGTKPIQVTGGGVIVVQSAGSGEDDNIDWSGTFHPLEAGDTIYAAYDLTITGQGAPVQTTYFAHFKNSGTFFNSRLGIAPSTVGGDYQLFLSGDGVADADGEAFWPAGLSFGTTYRVLHSYDFDTGSKSLWVDPFNEFSPSVAASDSNFSDPMVQFALRQNAGGNTTQAIDNLRIATDFDEALDIPDPSEVLLWDFNTSEGSSGWVTPAGSGGNWNIQNSLSAIRDDSEVPEIIIDSWSPEFRFTVLSLASLVVDLSAYAQRNEGDQLFLDIYRVSTPEVPGQDAPPLANLTTRDLGGISPTGETVQVDFVQDAFGGEIPEGHVDNESIYRIRTRVYDNDTNLWSFQSVTLDNLRITSAVLNIRGDYDLDGDVDGRDFLVWQREYGLTSNMHADGNGDGTVNMADLAVWQGNYGSGSASTLAADIGIPEPSLATLMAGVGACTVVLRKPKHIFSIAGSE